MADEHSPKMWYQYQSEAEVWLIGGIDLIR